MAGRGRFGRRLGALMGAVAALVGSLVVLAPPATAAIVVAPGISFPSAVTAGQTFAASISIGNFSTPPDSVAIPSVRITNVNVYPACPTATPAANCSNATPEAAFALASTGTAVSGPMSCTGTWSITSLGGGGSGFRFDPPGGNGSLLLATGESCTVSFSATSSKVPATDVSVAAGVQTEQVVTVSPSDAANPANTFPPNSGVSQTTVGKASPTFSTTAIARVAVYGDAQDRATVTSPVTPTGTVFFEIFGPDKPTCVGQGLGTSTTNLINGTAVSGSLLIQQPGTYHWVASYSGDANNNPASAACGDPGETTEAIWRVPADFDRDGKSDKTVFRGGAGVWYEARSGGAQVSVPWGTSGDVPVTADFDGDFKADVAVYRSGVWYIDGSGGTATSLAWGIAGDIPVAGDYDGDGKADPAVFRNGVWYVQKSAGGTSATAWGTANDVPVVGDYDGDGTTDLALFRPSQGAWFINTSALGVMSTTWGTSGDQPVSGDFDGDGKTDVAVYRPSTGQWFVLRSNGGSTATSWGTAGDQAVSGDYDGDGKTDFTVFRASTGEWFVNKSGGGITVVSWGATGDTAVPALGG